MLQNMVHALLTLALTLCLIVVFIYLLKKYTNKTKKNSNGIQLIKQLELGNKERIVVVEVEEVKLIIGISQHTFNTLHIIKNNEH